MTGRRSTRALAVALLAVVAAACGSDSDDGSGLTADTTEATATTEGGPRTVEVVMSDNEFTPAHVEVAAGETVTFAFVNEGEVTHDAVIGDEAAQVEHEAGMRAAESAMEAEHGVSHGSEAEGEGGAITVEPGAAGELTYMFAAGDEVVIGCHEPGHYDAGMKLDVVVA